MAETFEESLHDLAAKVGEFPEEAYYFVREGLSFAVHQAHGPDTPAQLAVMRFLVKNKLDLDQLQDLLEAGRLSKRIVRAIDRSGGMNKLNRHVSGADLCWGLRDYSHRRWGKLACLVLDKWNVRQTYDFGRLVFAMIDHQLMQKQPTDQIEDFRDVFVFREAIDEAYRIDLRRN